MAYKFFDAPHKSSNNCPKKKMGIQVKTETLKQEGMSLKLVENIFVLIF